MTFRCPHTWVPWLQSQTCTRCGLIREIVPDDSCAPTDVLAEDGCIRYTYPPPPPPLVTGPYAPALVHTMWMGTEAAALHALDAQDATWDDIPPEPD
jgi:hypothetical protein